MVGIVLGAASFFVVLWVDAVSVHDVRHVKPLRWISAVLFFLLLVCLLAAYES